ncbi:MAG: hypoxanthine phosphoribosyltransferase [Elusimicrobia bacterium]|nr:hypoxanthine phosphoribosyltransferase [Elusimicrobiota bacterium]
MPIMPHKNIEEILIPGNRINKRVVAIARKISRDYRNKDLVFVGVLKGCALFLSDLIKEINMDCSVDFICLSSYSGAQSTGVVRTILDLRQNIENKDVLVVEDIVDSGLTMNYLLRNLKTRRPRSIRVCTLLDKPSCRKVSIPIAYAGFKIPNKFVVGYGLDHNELYRNLPYIGVLKNSAI